jgi:hypothetical protein
MKGLGSTERTVLYYVRGRDVVVVGLRKTKTDDGRSTSTRHRVTTYNIKQKIVIDVCVCMCIYEIRWHRNQDLKCTNIRAARNCFRDSDE